MLRVDVSDARFEFEFCCFLFLLLLLLLHGALLCSLGVGFLMLQLMGITFVVWNLHEDKPQCMSQVC